ncbi:unnamed protein product [Rotaria magnacalcarata]|uniref:GH18 domain-containing protein n=2 Tax=Rotaria magnacalcarata TaxID=392030 RepID=A0A819JE54_9BILA|nr:unnamed protein product [Rotaria magnacalcarata]CAF3928746.1 unnamed protein product [Rotaria magnacalcarata]
MIPHCSNFVIYLWFSCVLINISIAQQYPRPRRLCVNRKNPSQYYPCALNYIGIKSWSIYQCPDQLLFDETLQKCYAKATPLSRRLDQRTLLSSLDNSLYEQINNLLRSNSIFQEEEQTTTIKPFWNDRSMNNGGVFWANGYPLMRLNNQPLFQSTPSLNSRLSYFSQQHPYPAPVSEEELKYKKICYFTNWSQYRNAPAKFEPEHIDPFLCTHIIYAFAYVSNKTFLIETVEENDEDLYRRINALKKRNPKLKTILGVGGWNMKSYAFSVMVHDDAKRRNFIYDSINFLHKHNFDGLEVDWEYPGIRGGQPDDKYYLTLFFQDFKEAALAQSIITNQPRLLIAAAVAASEDIISNAYEIDKIAKRKKYKLIRDFHGAWQNHTGLNAPLYRRYDETADEAMFNQDFGMSIWLKNGAPAHKLVLGIPLFSRTFLLARADDHDLRSPTIGNGTEGPYTRSAGFLSYFEACVFQMDPQWKKRAVPDGSESGYMYKDRDWISYDTLENVKKRAAYVVANHFGGLFAWSLDMDDFNGAFCNNGTYPFIKNSLSLLPTHLSSYL